MGIKSQHRKVGSKVLKHRSTRSAGSRRAHRRIPAYRATWWIAQERATMSSNDNTTNAGYDEGAGGIPLPPPAPTAVPPHKPYVRPNFSSFKWRPLMIASRRPPQKKQKKSEMDVFDSQSQVTVNGVALCRKCKEGSSCHKAHHPTCKKSKYLVPTHMDLLEEFNDEAATPMPLAPALVPTHMDLLEGFNHEAATPMPLAPAISAPALVPTHTQAASTHGVPLMPWGFAVDTGMINMVPTSVTPMMPTTPQNYFRQSVPHPMLVHPNYFRMPVAITPHQEPLPAIVSMIAKPQKHPCCKEYHDYWLKNGRRGRPAHAPGCPARQMAQMKKAATLRGGKDKL